MMRTSRPEAIDRRSLEAVLERWNGTHDLLVELGGRQSLSYGFSATGRELVLRFTLASRWSQPEVEAEIDWVRHLHTGGAPVSPPVASKYGNWVEEVTPTGGTKCLAVVYEKAPGKGINFYRPHEFGQPLFRRWGQAAGRIHALSKSYRPRPGLHRPQFSGESLVALVERSMPPAEAHAIESMRALWRDLDTLPRDEESFGLIHGDLSSGNFAVADGKLTVFDFDSCFYGWFAYDLAITLYFTLFGLHLKQAPLCEAESFFTQLMTGYERENRLREEWMATLPRLIAFFNLTLYAASFHYNWDNPDLVAFIRSILSGDSPYSLLDFADLYASLGDLQVP